MRNHSTVVLAVALLVALTGCANEGTPTEPGGDRLHLTKIANVSAVGAACRSAECPCIAIQPPAGVSCLCPTYGQGGMYLAVQTANGWVCRLALEGAQFPTPTPGPTPGPTPASEPTLTPTPRAATHPRVVQPGPPTSAIQRRRR